VPSSARQSITLVDCVDESTPATSIGGSLVELAGSSWRPTMSSWRPTITRPTPAAAGGPPSTG